MKKKMNEIVVIFYSNFYPKSKKLKNILKIKKIFDTSVLTTKIFERKF